MRNSNNNGEFQQPNILKMGLEYQDWKGRVEWKKLERQTGLETTTSNLQLKVMSNPKYT